jgi:GNAT superfamily N-acetyltransferase
MADVRELTGDDEIAAAFGLMTELRPHLTPEHFVERVRRQQQGGYRLFGLFSGSELVALAGVREAETLMRGPHLFVDDLVTGAADRGRGYGTAMLRWLAVFAGERGHARIYLDSRDTALTFYQSRGFTATTGVPCWIAVADLPAE